MISQKILIVGGGLSGSLLTILMAKRGFEVELFERRPDMRKENISAGKSINLALSDRGLRALKAVGLDEYILQEVVPMYGRQVHLKDGTTNFQTYSLRQGKYINSVSRGGLNKALLSKAEEYPNVKVYFDMRCTKMDYQTNEVHFHNEKTGEHYTASGNTVIGTDGSASAIRDSMQHGGVRRFDFAQYYLEHGYKELMIPAGEEGSFAIEKNALHIWPRHDFMLIGLANANGSFTCTLFMSYNGENGFDNLNSKEKVENFFKSEFPDAMKLMPTCIEDFMNNPTGALPTVKCFPWNVEGKSLLIGDAAHAIVPFYGQGMNCSFEDCLVLEEYIDKYGTDWGKIYSEYSLVRKPSTDAIADLAHENYLEMRSSTANPVFTIKRKLEAEMELKYPDFNSKYSMVSFSTEIPYHIAKARGEWQDNILMEICSKINSIEEVNFEEIYQRLVMWDEQDSKF